MAAGEERGLTAAVKGYVKSSDISDLTSWLYLLLDIVMNLPNHWYIVILMFAVVVLQFRRVA